MPDKQRRTRRQFTPSASAMRWSWSVPGAGRSPRSPGSWGSPSPRWATGCGRTASIVMSRTGCQATSRPGWGSWSATTPGCGVGPPGPLPHPLPGPRRRFFVGSPGITNSGCTPPVATCHPSSGNSSTPPSTRYHQPRPHDPGVHLPGEGPDDPGRKSVAVDVTLGVDRQAATTSVGPGARQPSFTAVPEALTISMLLPTVS
jgi:hypothetical protein